MLNTIRLGICLLLLSVGCVTIAYGAETTPPPPAQEQTVHKTPVSAALVSEEATIQPGHSFWVAVHLKLDERWHAYWKNPGDAGMAPIITWTLPQGFHAGEVQWTAPKRFTIDQTVGFGYEDETVLLVEITPPAAYSQSNATLDATVRWVVCNDSTCLPGTSPVHLELPVGTTTPKKISANATFFSAAREKIPQPLSQITAKHDDSLIELNFNDPNGTARTVKSAEFFPESDGVIKYTAEPLFTASPETPGKYTLVFEGLDPPTSLKGVLVFHTSSGSEAYAIDTPVTHTNTAESTASIASRDVPTDETAILGDKDAYSFEGGVTLAILLAFVGGMILNLMPCVLPVISFKILSFINLAGKQRRIILKHGLAFSGGVLLSFWIMAALLLALQAYGRSVGWGFQLQEPLFVAVLAAFIFVFGLSLFGLFEVGTSVMSKAGEVQHAAGKNNAMVGSFMSGMLATAVATPCTGPFLGSTVGFAVTLPPMEAMTIFTSLGLGMSSPYLVLAAFPSLLRLLPKPGNWMVTFKELMGFLMMASVIWLLWVFSAQAGMFALFVLVAGLFLMALGCWIYGRWTPPMCAKFTRTLGTVGAILFFGFGSYTIMSSTSDWAQAMGGVTAPQTEYVESAVADVWEDFSPKRVEELRAQGTPVFIDFTAKWCLICQANHVVLSSKEVAQKFAEKGVVRMKADWTKSDETIAAELKKFGRNSVPLYIVYGTDKNADAEILPQLLTPEIVLEALDKIKTKP